MRCPRATFSWFFLVSEVEVLWKLTGRYRSRGVQIRIGKRQRGVFLSLKTNCLIILENRSRLGTGNFHSWWISWSSKQTYARKYTRHGDLKIPAVADFLCPPSVLKIPSQAMFRGKIERNCTIQVLRSFVAKIGCTRTYWCFWRPLK